MRTKMLSLFVCVIAATGMVALTANGGAFAQAGSCDTVEDYFLDRYLTDLSGSAVVVDGNLYYLDKYLSGQISGDAPLLTIQAGYLEKYMGGIASDSAHCFRVSKLDEPTTVLAAEESPQVLLMQAPEPSAVGTVPPAPVPVMAPDVPVIPPMVPVVPAPPAPPLAPVVGGAGGGGEEAPKSPSQIIKGCIDNKVAQAHCAGLLTDAELKDIEAFEAELKAASGKQAPAIGGPGDGFNLLGVAEDGLNKPQLRKLNDKVDELIVNNTRSSKWMRRLAALHNNRPIARGYTTSRTQYWGGIRRF